MAQAGYIYILINPSISGLVKIGKTTREPEARARELSQATGVATPFYVAFSVIFADCDQAERYFHTILEIHGFRVTINREFFQVPLQIAIELLQEVQRKLASSSAAPAPESTCAPVSDDSSDMDSDTVPVHPAFAIHESAMAHWYGYGDTIEDMDEALRLLEQSKNLDFPASYTSLAEFYSEPWCNPPNVSRALNYLKEGAVRGHGRCFVKMADIFYQQGKVENFDKCWKKYFTSQTFVNDDDQKWTKDLELGLDGEGFSRIKYIEIYLDFTSLANIPLSQDLHRILLPFRDELVASINDSIAAWEQFPIPNAPKYVTSSQNLLHFVESVL